MRKFFRVSLILIVLTFVFGGLTACEEKNMLKQMEKNSKSLKSLRADITVERFNSQLEEYEVSKGKLIYEPRGKSDAHVRIDFISPMQESLSLIDKEYIFYRMRSNEAFVGSFAKPRSSATLTEALAFMNVSKEHLEANYNFRYIGKEKLSNGVLTQHLEFTPNAKKNYKTAEFWIDNKGMPHLIKVVEKNNDTITISLTNIEKNKTIKANDFKIILSKGTKIIKS